MSTEPTDPVETLAAVHDFLRESRRSEAPESGTQPAALQQAPAGRVLYRIVHQAAPVASDFTSNLTKCLPMRGAESKEPLLWSGLSMFDTLEAAVRNAQRFNGRLGRFSAELELPPEGDARVLIRQTLRPGHFTVLCCESTCISFIRDVQPIVGLSD